MTDHARSAASVTLDTIIPLIEECIRATGAGHRMRATAVAAIADSILCGLLNAGSEETRGLPPANCIDGRFPLPYQVLVIDLEPPVYRDYACGHDVTEAKS